MQEQQIKVNKQLFTLRLTKLFTHWKESDYTHLNTLVIVNGKESDRAKKIKVSAIYNWLFGYEFFESLLLICQSKIIILSRKKIIDQILDLESENTQLIVVDNPSQNVDNILDQLKSEYGSDMKLGMIMKEKQVGPLIQAYDEYINKHNIEIREIGGIIQEVLCQKEGLEIEHIKKAARICTHFQNRLIGEIENIVDADQQISHNDISNKIDNLLLDQKEQQYLQRKFNLNEKLIDFSYVPIVQSGSEFDLRPQAQSNDNVLKSDCIILSIGGKYNQYNANIVRTLFINPSQQMRTVYNVVLQLQEFIIERLANDKMIGGLYEQSIVYLNQLINQNNLQKMDLVNKLNTNLGFGMGLEFREGNLIINQKNENMIKENQVYNISIGINDLYDEKKKQKYAIMIADTVVAQKDEGLTLTSNISRNYKDISYQIDDLDQQVQQQQQKQEKISQPTVNSNKHYGTRKTRQTNQDKQNNEDNENKRKQHQKQLMQQKQQELQERLYSGKFKQQEKTSQQLKVENLKIYNQVSEINQFRKNMLQVDLKNNCVLVPFQKENESILVPFHGSVIKNINKHEEGRHINIRINFYIAQNVNIVYPELQKDEVFIKEITVKIQDVQRASDIIKKVKDLQKKIKQSIENKMNMNEIESNHQESLQLNKGKKPVMNDLKIRPNLTGKKIGGTLECHFNGFRYITQNRQEKVDILYRNIKHAFYQPCDNEMIILVHFNLYKPMMIGKKKTWDIQFFTEAGTMTEDLDIRGRRNNYDVDEYEQEERERQQRKKLNIEFESFTQAVKQYTREQDFFFDVPYNELAFYGTPQRSQVNLKPTLNCLVNLSETPFFVLTLEEVELAYFERIQFGLRQFDLSFVFKDYDRPVIRISAIGVEVLESVKNWLDNVDIMYAEGPLNLNWTMVMNQIKQDIEGFIEDGGWATILQDDSSDGGEDQKYNQEIMDQDSVFTPEQNENEAESDFSNEDSDFDEFDEESDFEEEELSEEGMDWEEMEEMTRKKEKEYQNR